MGEAVDFSYWRPDDPQDLVDAGYEVVLRYLGRDSRCITKPELKQLHAVNLRVGIIGQTTVSRPRGGYSAGTEDGGRYNGLADELQAPPWMPIFFVIDVGGGFPAPADYPAITEYTKGILDSSRRPVGMYGPYPVLEHLRDLKSRGRRVECWWQTAGMSGSGQGTGGSIRTGDGSVRRLSSLACMFQHVGLTGPFGSNIDHNSILMRPVTWAWHPDGPGVQPEEEEEDDDMIQLYWSRPGSGWVRDVAQLDNSASRCFIVEGGQAKDLGVSQGTEDHGWDNNRAIWWQQFGLAWAQHPEREHRDVEDALFEGKSYAPAALACPPRPVHIPALAGDAQFRLDGGDGTREFLSGSLAGAYRKAGVLGQTVQLDGQEAAAVMALPEANNVPSVLADVDEDAVVAGIVEWLSANGVPVDGLDGLDERLKAAGRALAGT